MSDGNFRADVSAYDTSIDVSFGQVYEVGEGLSTIVIANNYDNTKTYEVNDYVIYDKKLYRCIVAIEEPEEFNSEKWIQVKLADDVQDLAESLDAKADKSTTYTKSEVDEIAATKANTSDVEGALASKADKSTTYTKTKADNKFATNNDLGEFIGLVDGELDRKADKYNTYTKTEVDEIAIGKANASDVETALAQKADKEDTYTKSQVNSALSLKANSSSVYTKSQTYTKDETDDKLTLKADKSTTYTKTEIDTKFANLPSPMVFQGSIGVGGTVTELPVDGSANTGDTYKVITAGTYAGQYADIGDTFICDGKTLNVNTWTLIPSGDEPSGTVTSIKIETTSPINIDDSSAITTSGIRTISHANSGVIAGTYGDTSAQTPAVGETFKALSVTVDAKGHITNVDEHTVTMPSVANNVTGTGTSGSIARFDGTNSITNGPKIGSDITKFLRNDGNWEVPNYVTYTFAAGDNNGEIKVTPSNGQTQAVSVAGLNNSAYKNFTTSPVVDSDALITSGGAYTALLDKVDKNNPECTGSMSINRKANTVVGTNSIAMGNDCVASNSNTIAFGYKSNATGFCAVTIGRQTTSSGSNSFSEGFNTTASGVNSHAEGMSSTASGDLSHTEGAYTIASGECSHAEGRSTIAAGNNQHVFGMYNIEDTSQIDTHYRNKYVEIVGNGYSNPNEVRSNCRTLDWDGNEWLSGDLTYNGNKSLTSEISRLDGRIDNLPNPTVITGTLVAGQTSLTLQSAYITTNSMIEIFTSDGTEWNNITVTDGQIVITFYAQASDLGVKVRVS